MSDWIHCNKCSVRHNNNEKFFLVECGHIFCQRCVEKIKASHKCMICNKAGQVLLLNKDVEQNVMDFFLPVESFIKKTLEVYKFQLQHRTTLFQNLLNKYNYAKKEYINCHNANRRLMKENQMLRSMLRSAGHNPQPFATSTPVSQISNNTLHNTSILSSIPPHMVTNSAGKNSTLKMYPGYPRRNEIHDSAGSSQRPSPAQMVPLGQRKFVEPSMIHHDNPIGAMYSLEQLRRGGKSQ